MTITGDHPPDRLSRFRRERTAAMRPAATATGAVAIIGLPLWSVFDHLVAPADAWDFTTIRLAGTAAIALGWALLFTPLGRRRPELCGLAILAPVQIAIGLMIVQLDSDHAAYALGMSLAVFASGLFLPWRLRYTLAVIGVGAATLALGWLLEPGAVDAATIATVSFYLVTASAIAITAQVMWDREALRSFTVRMELELEQKRSEALVAKLDRLSREDPLTGLVNRRGWDEAIARQCAQVRRSGGTRTVSVLLCDVDRLKEINDSLGHATGDMVLRRVAELLEPRIRAADVIARIGGDEFAILATDATESEAATLAEEIRERVSAAQPGGPTIQVTVSLGVAEWDGSDDSPETLMMRADRRLYAAKARRNVVCAGDPVETR